MADLLIGCGNSRVRKMPLGRDEWEDLVTIDHDPNCGADILHDLDDTPWPIEDNSFKEAHAYEVLEHLGQQGDYKAFFRHFGEIYRVLEPGGLLVATVPAYNDKWAWGDPSHTRIINHCSLVFLSQDEYKRQVGTNSMTDFRWLWKGDFKCEAAEYTDNGTFVFALRAIKHV